ncbi:hypothetical protein CRUP_010217 [Coryphaenoides rupestris]|nr:hypothetical protein CRUP_010217 [Coryphaenoides rupestris]
MVATRRGALVCSPNKTTRSDESLGVQATPSTGRRTRRGATQLDTATAASEEEPRSQTQESAEESVPCSQSRQMLRRCARSSRLHSPSQHSTPAGSVHEADVSDMESICSALSDSESPVVRSQRRGRKSPPPRTVSQEEEAASEAESCSAPLSEKRRTRRSTRARKTPERPYTSQSDTGEQEGSSQRATRSTRRSTRAKTPAKTASKCAELSDADSCVSSASEAPASVSSTSTAGRATHLARRAALGQPIALCLDAPSEGSQSPAPAGGRRRGTRATRGALAACSEQLSYDSEGLESGPGTPPAPRRSTRSGSRGGRSLGVPATDSDSETLGPAQSDTGLSVVLERVPGHSEDPGENPLVPTVAREAEPAGDDNQLNESKLEITRAPMWMISVGRQAGGVADRPCLRRLKVEERRKLPARRQPSDVAEEAERGTSKDGK